MVHIPNQVPAQLIPEIRKVFTDAVLFFKMLKIQDKYTGEYKPFDLYPEPEELLLELDKHKKIIVIKPRQIGISTLLRAYAFWKTYTATAPSKFGVLSFHQRSAQHLRKMDSRFLQGLPTLLQRETDVNNTTELIFADTQAGLASYTARSTGGTRSFTLNSAHLSEFAFYPDQDEVLAQVMATVGTGQIVIESTPNSVGDTFHRLCAEAPDNGWTLLTFWWWQHEHYKKTAPPDFVIAEGEHSLVKSYGLDNDQLQWRREQISTLGMTKFKREYPACIEDAFNFGSSKYFDPLDMDMIESVRFDSNDRKYEDATDDDVYAMGVDVAAGVGGDYSTIAVVSMSTYEPVYQYRCNTINIADFAEKVLFIAQEYNDAKVLVESNNHGHVIIQKLLDWRYNNMWYNPKGKHWTTTAKSKIEAYETLREVIHSNMISRLDMTTLIEIRSLTVYKICPEAPQGLHDDLADSLALAYRCAVDIPKYEVHNARKSLMDEMISNRRAIKNRKKVIPYRRAR